MRNSSKLVGVSVLAGLALVSLRLFTAPPLSPDAGAADHPGSDATANDGVLAGLAASPWSALSWTASPWTASPWSGKDPTPRAEGASAYFDDRVMVRADPAALTALVTEHDVKLLRQPGPAGYAVLALPAGMSPEQFAGRLRSKGRVDFAGPVGRTMGADVYTAQWHRDEVLEAGPRAVAPTGAVVAVLDSGVAYEAGTDPTTGASHVAISTLASSTIVAPYDFINDDDKPYDDHMHGTHIASLIASYGGYGSARGLAPQVGIMPIKVLDQDNSGDEVALIDGLWWAIDNEADVVNMSLSFLGGYVPSAALLEVLEAAWEADVVVVAAAGNVMGSQATWPARSPLVIGVAATVGETSSTRQLTAYSNVGTGVLIAAPGGDLGQDLDGDGVCDGMLGQTIRPGNPASTAHYFMAGTSQASAMVSASAAWYRNDGRSAWSTYVGLQADADASIGGFADGAGAGRLEIWEETSENASIVEATHYVTLLPYLMDNGDGTVTPTTLVHLEEGAATVSTIYVSFHGSTSSIEACTPDSSGDCTVQGAAVDGSGSVVSWSTVDAVIQDGVSVPVRTGVFSSDALQSAVDLITTEVTTDAALGFYWEDETDTVLGDIAAGMTSVNMGRSFASSPLGLVLNQAALDAMFTGEDTAVDLDGSGFASSPMGWTTIKRVSGSGFASSPMGSKQLTLLKGSGFASSPMGSALAMIRGEHTGSTFVPLDGSPLDSTLVDTPVGNAISSNSWSNDGDGGVGEAIVATSVEAGIVDDATLAESVSSGDIYVIYQEAEPTPTLSRESPDVYSY